MKDQTKTKKQLIEELEALRSQATELNKSETKFKQSNKPPSDPQHWQTVFDSINDAISFIDAQGKIIQCNKTMVNLVKKPIHKILGQKCWKLVHGTSEPIPGCPIIRMKETLKQESLTLPIGDRWFEVTADPVFDKAGKLAGAVHFIVDITKQKRAEETLQKSEKLYSLLAANAYDMITRHLPDSTYLYVSPACRTLFGYEPEELIGTKAFDQMHPDDVKRVIAITQESVRTGGSQMGQYRHLRKDGQYIWVETVGKVIKNEETGAIEDIICVVRDITERKRAEDAILQTKRDWEDIFQAIGHPTIILDTQHNILFANRATLRAVGAKSEDELKDKKCYELFHNTSEPPEGCPLEKLLASTKLEANEMEIEALGGVFLVSCTPVFDEKGDLEKVIHIATDITERKRAEELLLKEKNFIDSAINSLPGVFYLFDENSQMVKWNHNLETVAGYSTEEISKMHPLDFFAGEEKKLAEDAIKEVFIKGESNVEANLISKDGGKRPYFFTGLRFVSDNQNYLVGMGTDITERKRAEETLRMSEERFRILFENTPLGTGVSSLEGKLLAYNEAIIKITGYTKEELLNFNIRSLYQNVEDRNALLKELQSNGYVRNYEVILKRKNGASFYANLTINLIAYDGEKALLTVVEDITERKLAEESMRASELKYRKLVELTQTGFLILDHRGSVIDANNEYVRLTGHHALTEIIGRSVIEWTAEHEKEKNAMAIEECMRVGYINNLEIDYVDGQGRITPIEINAFMEGQGETLRIISLCRDITERKQSEEQILMLNAELEQRVAERTAQLEAANMELGNEITERKQKEEKIKRQNILLEGINWIVREALTVETEEELSSQCLAISEELTGSRFGFIDELNEAGTMDSITLSDPGWKSCRMPHTDTAILLKNIPVRGIYADAIKKGISLIVNDPGSHPDRVELPEGHPPITAFLGVPLKQGEKVIGLIGLANKESGYDAEDQQNIEMISIAFIEALNRIRSENIIKNLNKELEQSIDKVSLANKELEAFSYSVSHDLRAPLRAIDGFTEILLREYSPKLDDEGKRICSVITGNSKKMGQLIDELLSLSRLDRTVMRFSSIDMNDLVNAVYEESTTPEMRQRINFHLDDLKKAHGDPILIRQVWINLLSNAVKFTSHNEQPVISITRREEEEQTVFCVKDNGAGFNMQYADKLFKVFQRLHNEKEFEGTGVGLAIVQRIVHRHGGKIWAEGEVDKGATFFFTMPI